ncbi:MAG: twin transmembrane helix small protein [Burkholderiales bacterium]
MNILIALAFLAIIGSLVAALFFMLKGRPDDPTNTKGRSMSRALAWRVGFSVVLFICVLAAWKLGYIQPTGIPQGK